MNTNTLAAAIVAKAAGISGMRGTSALTPDSLPASPWTVVGPHRATYDILNASRSRVDYTFPLACYVERTADSARTQSTVNTLVDAFVAAYATGLQLSGTVAECYIQSWDTNGFVDIGGSSYQVIELSLYVLVWDTTTHTP